jgi:hypothetical protein
MAEQNSTFNPLDEERESNRPDIPGLKAQEGINSNSTSRLKNGYSNDSSSTNSSGNSNSLNSNQTNNDKGDARSNLSEAESSPWKNSAMATSVVSSSATGAAGLAAKGVKGVFFGSPKRKKATIGGSIGATIIGGAITFFSIFAGPAQLIQLSHVLQSNFSNSQNVTSSRANKLFRYASTSDANEARVGVLGRQFLKPAVQNLEDIGIKFDLSTGAGLNSATIDTTKLAATNDDLQKLSVEDRAQWLDTAFPSAAGQFVYQGDGVYSVDTSGFALSADSALVKSGLSQLGDGKIITGINSRVFSDYLNVSSLFHPISRTTEAALKKLSTASQKKKEAQDEEKTADAGVDNSPEAVSAESDAESQSNAFSDPLEKTLLVAGTACFMRGISGDINTLNRDEIAEPAEVEGLRFVAIGAQIETGQDVNAYQINDLEAGLQGPHGGDVFQADALEATEGLKDHGDNGDSRDLPGDYKQAFTGSGTADKIKSWANASLGGSLLAGAACSGPGQVVQILTGLTLNATDIFDGGVSTVALYAAEQGESFVASALVMGLLHNVILNKTTDGKLASNAFSGTLGGNLLAYGARYAADVGGAAEGLVPQSGTNSTTTAYVEQQQNQKQFASESVFARVFDINDGRTILGQLADSFKPSVSQSLSSAVSNFSDIGGNLFSSITSIFSPKTSASAPYDWGFPQVGISNQMLNNPQLANPYSNGDDVATILNSSGCVNSDGSTNSGCALITKANTCFGDNIEKDPTDPTGNVWDVVKDHPVDPTSDSYQNANCGDESDMTWERVTMFVVDTRTMQAMACYKGDSQSCQEIGQEDTASGGSTATTTTASCGSSSATTPATTTPSATTPATTTAATSYFTVTGSTVCDANGNIYIPYGISVNDSLVGPEWQNQQFQAATTAQIEGAAKYWDPNTIRIQVSESDVMGTSTDPTSYNTAAMKQLGDQVSLIESLNMIPVISDNTEQSDATETGPTARTEAFWKAVMSYLSSQSSTTTSYSNVIFDIFNEPSSMSWDTWKNGGTGTGGFKSVGMQDVVNSIRNVTTSPLSNNLIWAEGPYYAGTLDGLDKDQLSGTNVEYSYHHVDFTGQSKDYKGSTDWKGDAGLELTAQVPIVDGEWAQYASSRPECYPQAPQDIDSYFNTLQTNNIGLVFWSLEPGVGTTTPAPAPVSDKIASDWIGSDGKFPITASDFSQPNTFPQSGYSCTGGTDGQPLKDQGAGSKVMQFFQANNVTKSSTTE